MDLVRYALVLALLTVVTLVVMTWAGVRLRTDAVVATVRALVQLGLISLVIAWAFRHPAAAAALLVVMLAAAAFTSTRRIGLGYATYPIALVALVALIRHDRGARWYILPMATIGALISTWHYLVEWHPTWEGTSCSLFGPACADIWFRTWGFSTLAFMALSGFVSIIVFNTVTFPPTDEQEQS